jgi:DNA-binding transcriptional regulator LsrR (DeoR family)
MTVITEARDAYLAAREAVTATRLALGKAIADARAQGTEQVDIARKLNLTREQVRRYQDEYEKAAGIKPSRDS